MGSYIHDCEGRQLVETEADARSAAITEVGEAAPAHIGDAILQRAAASQGTTVSTRRLDSPSTARAGRKAV